MLEHNNNEIFFPSVLIRVTQAGSPGMDCYQSICDVVLLTLVTIDFPNYFRK